MDIKEFYDKAADYADKLKELVQNNAVNSTVCVLRSDKGGIICGIASVGVFNGEIKKISAETAALNNLYLAGGAYAAAMIILDMNTKEIKRPDPGKIKKMTKSNIDNMTCMVVLSMDEAAVATELIPKVNFFEGFGDSPEETENKEKEYVSELEISEDNPFAAAANQDNVREVVTLEPSGDAPKEDSTEYINNEPSAASTDSRISKEDLLREAKERKKAAKAFFNFKKKY